MSIRNKLLLSVVFFLFIPMLFMPLFVYHTYEGILEKKINASSQQALVQIANSMSTVIDNIIAASNMISLDQEIIDILYKRDYNSEYNKYTDQKKVQDKLDNAKNAVLYPYNADAVIIGFNGNIYSSAVYDTYDNFYRITNQDWFKETVRMNGYMLWMAPAGKYINNNEHGRGNIAMAHLIKGDKGIGGYGVLFISLYPEMRIGSLLNGGQKLEGSHLLLLNDEGSIIMASDSSINNHDLANADFLKI